MAPRPAYVHPSGLSPAEYDTYAAWTDELDSHISKLGRGLRFGEMLAFVRKRTPVDREAEIMSFFGSIPQQQSLGVGEFIAILRLLAHARTCTVRTRDHIFIQTHPLVLTTPFVPLSSNPFLRAPIASSILERLDGPQDVNLREAAAKKKRILSPLASVTTASDGISISPIKGSSTNPFRMQPTPESPVQELRENNKASTLPSRPELSVTAKSPPLPPRRQSLPKQPPPKHASQLHKKLDDWTQTPTYIKPLHVPAIGPTSLDIISSSLQSDHTEQSVASVNKSKQNASSVRSFQSLNVPPITGEIAVRLLGSSHIGVDAKPLRARTPVKHSSSSEDFTLHKNASDSSLSSLGGMLPRARRDTQSSATTSTAAESNGRDLRYLVHREEEEIPASESTFTGVTTNVAGQTTLKGLVVKSNAPLPPPPRRRRPESLHVTTNPTNRAQKLVFGSTPSTGHPGPYSATSIQSSPAKHRSNSTPYVSHGRAASVAGSAYSQPPFGARSLNQSAQTLTRSTSVSHKHTPLDTFISKGRDVSHEWLEKAKAGISNRGSEDRQGLIMANEVTYTAKAAAEDGNDSDNNDADGEMQRTSVQARRREMERIRTEEEPGWARLG